MPIRNTKNQYGSVAKFLHWGMFLLIAALILVGSFMEDVEPMTLKFQVYGLHKSLGISVLILVAVRLFWKITNTGPSLPAHMKPIEKLMAHAGHAALYLLLIAMPVSGWMMSSAAGFPVSVFGLFTMPDLVTPDRHLMEDLEEVHELLANAIMFMVALHAGAALLHHFYHKDNVLKRMLPFVKIKEENDA